MKEDAGLPGLAFEGWAFVNVFIAVFAGAWGFWFGGLGEGFAAILESSSFQQMVVAPFVVYPAGGSTSTRMGEEAW